MDCVIVAGGVPGQEDPLYPFTQGQPKALLDMGGRTSLERVADALQGADCVDEIVVVGLGDDRGMRFQRPVFHVADQGSLVGNAITGVDWLLENRPAASHFIACSADIPTLTSAILDEHVDRCRPFDKGLYYTLISKETMERRFPGSNRTFVKLKGLEVAGGDLVVMQFDAVHGNRELWQNLANARKHAWKIARSVGLSTMLRFITRQMRLSDIEATAYRLMGAQAKVILSPFAELAMDADKPYQIERLRQEFIGQDD
jgi:GTP:adenosylcobinamide-phosphate guanylyltransferase